MNDNPLDAVSVHDFAKEGRPGEVLGQFLQRRIAEKKAERMASGMTVAGIQKVVAAIAKASNDEETAHAMEDALWESVLEHIALVSDGRSGDLAAEALKTREIKFPRWCA